MRTYEEINARIESGDAVVMTAEEVKAFAAENGVEKVEEEVDVVTTGTFGAMCSSGAFINFGHSEPPIKMAKIWLNDVPTYTGLAAVDGYIGATELSEGGPRGYGGAHVIEELVAGKAVHLRATSNGTDCYPRKDIDTYISLRTVNQAYLFNPRNMYQNYGIATNSSDKVLYTYMGKLLPHNGNATFSSAGQLSPLLNDPQLLTIGMGTQIFLGGGVGYVSWEGTQYKTNVPTQNGVPTSGARTLAVIGDLKQMNPEYLRGLYFTGYGTSLGVGIGVPIPILNRDVAKAVSITEDKLFANVQDYSIQSRSRKPIKQVSYQELRSGSFELNGKQIRTSSLSSYRKAVQITKELKEWIQKGEFKLVRPAGSLPADEDDAAPRTIRSHRRRA